MLPAPGWLRLAGGFFVSVSNFSVDIPVQCANLAHDPPLARGQRLPLIESWFVRRCSRSFRIGNKACYQNNKATTMADYIPLADLEVGKAYLLTAHAIRELK